MEGGGVRREVRLCGTKAISYVDLGRKRPQQAVSSVLSPNLEVLLVVGDYVLLSSHEPHKVVHSLEDGARPAGGGAEAGDGDPERDG